MAAFFVESGMSVNGVVVPPESYLKKAFALAREKKAVCIADEVQTCMGRTGKWFL